ncbi:hypothetical protein PFISCL1PPCAC_14266, partial [Pristionchus fissidentatus]
LPPRTRWLLRFLSWRLLAGVAERRNGLDGGLLGRFLVRFLRRFGRHALVRRSFDANVRNSRWIEHLFGDDLLQPRFLRLFRVFRHTNIDRLVAQTRLRIVRTRCHSLRARHQLLIARLNG